MPVLPDEFPAHPARDVSIRSMTAVEAGDRDGWLALFADDAVVQDPIGVSALDPTGLGASRSRRDRRILRQRHRAQRGAVHHPRVVGSGQRGGQRRTHHHHHGRRLVVHTDGVFTYRIDDDQRISALRAYWSVDRLTFG